MQIGFEGFNFLSSRHHATTFLDFPSAAERTATQVLTFLGNRNISKETEHGLALLSRGS